MRQTGESAGEKRTAKTTTTKRGKTPSRTRESAGEDYQLKWTKVPSRRSNMSPSRYDYSLSMSSSSFEPRSLPLVEQAPQSTPPLLQSGLYHQIRLQHSCVSGSVDRT